MTRTERIRKLATAIKDYRGSYVDGSNPRKWIRRPQPGVLPRICCWLQRLDADIPVALDRIDNFEKEIEMTKFLKELEEAKPSTHRP